MGYLIMDLEYNQFPSKDLTSHEIIQIGAVYINNPNYILSVSHFDSLVKPKKPVVKKVLRLTGIKYEDLKEAKRFDVVSNELEKWIKNRLVTLVTWGEADYSVLIQNYFLHRKRANYIKGHIDLQAVIVDYFKLDEKISLKDALSLFDLAGQLDVHNALNDAKSTMEVLKEMSKLVYVDLYKESDLILNPLLTTKKNQLIVSDYGKKVLFSCLDRSKLDKYTWDEFIRTGGYIDFFNHYNLDHKSINVIKKRFPVIVEEYLEAKKG